MEKILLSIASVLIDFMAIIFMMLECLYKILNDTLLIILLIVFLIITSPLLLILFLIIGFRNERRNEKFL